VIVILREFRGKKWVLKYIKEVDMIVVEGDRNIKVRMNGKVLKL